MRRAIVVLSAVLLVGTLSGAASADLYSDPLVLNQPLIEFLGIGIPYAYLHDNPYEAAGFTDWHEAAADGRVNSVELTLNVCGLDHRTEHIDVWVDFFGDGDYESVGSITDDGDAVFDLVALSGDPTGGVNGLPAAVRLDGTCFGAAMLNTSTLNVDVSPIPVPGAVLLAAIGLGTVGVLRRRFS